MATENSIPEILLSIDSTIYRGTLGSYCWNNICVTKAMPSDFDFNDDIDKIKLQKNDTIAINMDNFTPPENFHVTIFNKGNTISMDEDVKNQFSVNLQKGSYVVNVMAGWMYKGDVSYLFAVEVH